MLVGTIGTGVPEEVLLASGADVVAIEGVPGGPTDLADRHVEPMVGERARAQLQAVLDGSHAGVELLLCSREEEAPLRLFYTLRELRRLEPERGLPRLHLVDLQHVARPATRRWNVARIRELCALLDVDPAALPAAIRACNERRRALRREGPVYLAGSLHDPSFVLTAEDGDALDAIAARYEHPLLARARASSDERAAALAEDAVATRAERVVAHYLEGDDGLRWELPELRDACAARGLAVELRDHQPHGRA
jgi:hypothetical protein